MLSLRHNNLGYADHSPRRRNPPSFLHQARILIPDLVVLDGLGERLDIDSLVQLVLVQQFNEEVQGALMGTHLGVEAAHLLVHVHIALRECARDQRRAL